MVAEVVLQQAQQLGDCRGLAVDPLLRPGDLDDQAALAAEVDAHVVAGLALGQRRVVLEGGKDVSNSDGQWPAHLPEHARDLFILLRFFAQGGNLAGNFRIRRRKLRRDPGTRIRVLGRCFGGRRRRNGRFVRRERL